MTRIQVNLNDPAIPAESRDKWKVNFAMARLCVKEALKKQGDDFDDLISYALYNFSREDFAVIYYRTDPVREANKVERRMLVERSTYDELPELPFKLEIGSLYMIANDGSGQPKIVDFTKEYVKKKPYKEVVEELALMTFECREVTLEVVTLEDLFGWGSAFQPSPSQPSRKSRKLRSRKLTKTSDLMREVVHKNTSTSDSTSNERADSKKSDNDENQELTKKPTAKKSKHQGKAKTFKRKTQKRGRV